MHRLVILLSIGYASMAMSQSLQAQDTQEIQRLKQRIEQLERENELLRKEIELLKGGQSGAPKPAPNKLQAEAPKDVLLVDLGKGVKMEFIHIKAGSFLMGSPESDKDAERDEKPQHRVKITKDYYLGKYPVTQEQYAAVTGKNLSHFSATDVRGVGGVVGVLTSVDTRHFPADRATWEQAVEFCNALKRLDKSGRTFCLPTEAEWEYAARAGTTTRYFFGDDAADLGTYAWYNENSDAAPYPQKDRAGHITLKGTHAVGTKKPNPWGLYDMNGNVWQWCSDRFDANYYTKSPEEDPQGRDQPSASGLDFRVLRGNTWSVVKRDSVSASLKSRSAFRSFGNPVQSNELVGFRVCVRLNANDKGSNPGK